MERAAGYLNVGDLIFYGKFKNALARVISFGVNEKGDPTVEAQPVNKDGSDKKGKPKTLVLLKVRKVKKAALSERVASRFLIARGIGLGKTWENAKVRVHRYSNSFHVWDLANAGKRGKKVRKMIILPDTFSTAVEKEWLEQQSRHLVLNASRGYDSIKQYFERLDDTNIVERPERGIDVLPGGTQTIKLDWGIGTTEMALEASPLDFSVRSSVKMGGDGKPSFRQDTNYWPAKKGDAKRFYAWLSAEGADQIKKMDIMALRKLWRDIEVRYDYH